MASNRARFVTTSLVPLLVALSSTAAFAGAPNGTAPAPGILALVAVGVIGAIAIARKRK